MPPSSLHSSQLIRTLADLDLLEGSEPAGDFAEGLGQWLHFTDAIALSSVLDSGMAKLPPQTPAQREATGAQLTAQWERVQAYLTGAIKKSCTPGAARQPVQLPQPSEEVTFVPYRRFYEAHQRDMELSVEPLRVNLRAALAKTSPEHRKLAELDVVMDKFLRPREAQLLARVPALLQKRFDALHEAHLAQLAARDKPDSCASWMAPGGWLAGFCQDMQTVLLAEVTFRLQPSAGLLEAFNHHKS